MGIEPKILNNVCLNAHPKGCKTATQNQIKWIQSQKSLEMPKRVLVVGCSGGFGLAARITAAFGGGADTVGVSFEREPSVKKPGTPGWYNNRTFEQEAGATGLKALTIEGDAFSREIKEQTVQAVRENLGKVDLLIYSLASPLRVDPEGKTHRSVLKPIGKTFKEKSVDFLTGEVKEVEILPAAPEEIEATVKVMGGEDWKLWIDALLRADVLEQGAQTVAFSYIGPRVTYPVYWEGSIGKAKEHLEQSSREISEELKKIGGKAYVSVNKALVTRASAVIPVVPLYISLLFKVMREKGIHEDCIEQMYRLFGERLYDKNQAGVPTDENGRIRIDDREMREDVQKEVLRLWGEINSENLKERGDPEIYRQKFLELHGFGLDGVDYEEEVNYQSIND